MHNGPISFYLLDNVCVKSRVLGFDCPTCIAGEVVLPRRHDDELMLRDGV